MPGSGTLNIDVMDYDNAFSHDLIGRTVIDIESRYFDMSWKTLSEKPIERLQFYHDDFPESQGEMTLWIDVFDKKEQKAKQSNLHQAKARRENGSQNRCLGMRRH